MVTAEYVSSRDKAPSCGGLIGYAELGNARVLLWLRCSCTSIHLHSSLGNHSCLSVRNRDATKDSRAQANDKSGTRLAMIQMPHEVPLLYLQYVVCSPMT